MSQKKEKKMIILPLSEKYRKNPELLYDKETAKKIREYIKNDLEGVVREMEKLEHNIIATKGKEYTQKSQDKARNFNRAADDLNISPLKVCWIYLKKQLDGILNYVIDEKTYSGESIEQRVADAVNYLHFLIYIIRQREKK